MKRKLENIYNSKVMYIVIILLSLFTLCLSPICSTVWSQLPAAPRNLSFSATFPVPSTVVRQLIFAPQDPLLIPACDQPYQEGMIYYREDKDILYLCDGANWNPMGGSLWEHIVDISNPPFIYHKISLYSNDLWQDPLNDEYLRVGIGTSNPTDLLHVNGGALTVSDDAPTINLRDSSSGDDSWSIHVDGDDLMFRDTDGNTRMIIEQSGNVGIGGDPIINPGKNLDVDEVIRVIGGKANLILEDDTDFDDWFIEAVGTNSGTAELDFRIGRSRSNDSQGTAAIEFVSERGSPMVFLNGNVGIGTSDPSDLLTVESDDSDFQLRTFSDSNNSGIDFKRAGNSVSTPTIVQDGDRLGTLDFRGYDGNNFINAAKIVAEIDGTPGANSMPGQLRFSTTPLGGVSTIERMVITSRGRVGIGTSNPVVDLHIAGGGTLRLEDTAVGIELIDSDDDDWKITAGSNLSFSANSGGGPPFSWVEMVTFENTGNVGIGDTTPTTTLDVNGDITADSLYFNGGCWGDCPSDRNLKRNIVPLSKSLERIVQLEPVSFEYKDSRFGEDEQTALIAQDVQAVFPDWVSTSEEGYKQIRYGMQIQMHMIQAMKEMNNKIEAMENIIEASQSENEALKERIKILESM